MKNYSIKTKHILRNINILITVLVILVNIIALLNADSSKSNFITISFFLNIYIFFLHWYLLAKQLKKNVNEIKKEALYINYPVNIGTFFFCIILILIASAVVLFVVNKEAFVPAFIFTFFMSIISMLFPSIIMLAYIFFVIPAFIVPSFKSNRKNRSDSTEFLVFFLVLFSIFTIYKLTSYSIRTVNIENQNKYKVITLPIQYSTKYLKLIDISPYGKKRLSQYNVNMPFVYTNESFIYQNYNSAKNFCLSLGARIPNYLEAYNIVFNRFDTFGEKYYWTSNKDGRIPLVIHFKNMSYTVEKYNGKVKPLLYCVADGTQRNNIYKVDYFYKDNQKENIDTLKDIMSASFNEKALLDIIGQDYNPDVINNQEIIKNEKKHVNFSVKEVSSDIMEELIKKGYVYNKNLKIDSEYETNDIQLSSQINRDPNKKIIRLCYYPFIDYGNLSIFNESQIWKQSFCSPAFELVSQTPIKTTKNEKDSYCASQGGRLPNIPELNGILKSLYMHNIGTKFWINNKITDPTTNFEQSILVYYKDSRFLKIQSLNPGENDSAFAFCIKEAKNPSRIIVNYKSKFNGIEGYSYAKSICPNCEYYEVPDTILLRY